MLASQRHRFAIPADVAFLDAAAYGPMSLRTQEAGASAISQRGVPWTATRDYFEALAERARQGAAALIGAVAGDVAIVTSVSHAIATAARNLTVPAGARILRLADEHPSNALEWERLARERHATVEVVPAPADRDWTRTVVEHIERPGAPPLAVAALTPLHWTDGARVDLARIAPLARGQGAALVIDATQEAGALPISVSDLRPDFLAFPSFKWVLGPHSLAFLYAAPAHQQGEPLDRNAYNSRITSAFAWNGFASGARRYDMGERGSPVALEMAVAALEQLHEWGAVAVAQRLSHLTALLAAHAEEQGYMLIPAHLRAPHVLGLRPSVPTQRTVDDLRKAPAAEGKALELMRELAKRNVLVSERNGALRITPHVYNDEADIERFAAALRATRR